MPRARRNFLVLAGSFVASLGASRSAPAADLAFVIRDRWLFGRLADLTPRVKPDVIAWPLEEGEAPVGREETGPVVALNETAIFLLERCRGALTVGEIAHDLHLICGAPIEEARRDAAITIRAFHRLGLISI